MNNTTDKDELSRLQREALTKFTDKWERCPLGIHVRTLGSLIDRKLIVWKATLPLVVGVGMGIIFGWKSGYKFRLAAKGRKNLIHRLDRL